jgi:hypothetical protein
MSNDLDDTVKNQNVFEAMLKMMMELLKVILNLIASIFNKATGKAHQGEPPKKTHDVNYSKKDMVITNENDTEAPKIEAVEPLSQDEAITPLDDIKRFNHQEPGRHGIAQARDILKECDLTKSVEVAEGYFLIPSKILSENQKNMADVDEDFKSIDFSTAKYWIVSKDKQIAIESPSNLKYFLINKDKILEEKPVEKVEVNQPKENEIIKPKVKQKELER